MKSAGSLINLNILVGWLLSPCHVTFTGW